MLLFHNFDAVGGAFSYCLKYLGDTPTLYSPAWYDYGKKQQNRVCVCKPASRMFSMTELLGGVFPT